MNIANMHVLKYEAPDGCVPCARCGAMPFRYYLGNAAGSYMFCDNCMDQGAVVNDLDYNPEYSLVSRWNDANTQAQPKQQERPTLF